MDLGLFIPPEAAQAVGRTGFTAGQARFADDDDAQTIVPLAVPLPPSRFQERFQGDAVLPQETPIDHLKLKWSTSVWWIIPELEHSKI